MNALEQKVLELIGENTDSPDVFADTDEGMAQIRESISDAVTEIAMLTGNLKRQYYLPLREGQSFYRIVLANGDFGWVSDCWCVNRKFRLEQTDFTRVSKHDPKWLTYTGSPEAYMQIGRDIIGIYPKPSSSVDMLEITLVEIPFDYETDAGRVKLREAWKYATVHYAVAEFWASRGDAAEAMTHFQMYLETLGLRQQYMQQIEQVRGFRTEKEPWPVVTP